MRTTPLRRRTAALTGALLSVSLVLTACGSDDDDAASPGETTRQSAAPTTRSVTADNGTIQVPADPKRVATIGNTTLPFIDLGGKPIAVTAESDSDVARLPQDQRATYASAKTLAASADEVDLEELASLKPDLILVQVPSGEFDGIKTQLEAIAPTVFFGLDTEWKALADGLAAAGNTTAALTGQKADFDARLTGIKQKYAAFVADSSFVDITRYSSSDPGTFAIADIGCSEIARDEVGMDFPKAAEGADPLAYTALSFEQLGELSKYDVITYPVDAAGQPTEPFLPVVQTSTWKALPEVTSGHALGVFCPGNNSYGAVLQYLESLDKALATLPAKG
jgi:iron complex transport system substrate-binding protein